LSTAAPERIIGPVTPRRLLATVCAALVPVLTACSVSCTAVGCISAVFVDLTVFPRPADGRVRVTTCLDTTCTTSDVDLATNPAAEATVSDAVGRRATTQPLAVRVTVTAADGATLADLTTSTKLTRQAPNGDRCGPVCYSGGLRYDAGRLVTA
jgi:hypothetical protein